jgi:hypothetical protein
MQREKEWIFEIKSFRWIDEVILPKTKENHDSKRNEDFQRTYLKISTENEVKIYSPKEKNSLDYDRADLGGELVLGV